MENIKFAKKCPKCNKLMSYATKKGLNQAEKNNTSCKTCINILNSEKYSKFNLNILLNGSNESFYWIGFILTDGSFSKPKNKNSIKFKFALEKTDFESVEKLSIYLGNIPITSWNSKTSIMYEIGFSDLISTPKFMEKFSINLRKTYNPPEFKNYLNYNFNQKLSLLCGVIDGDGNIELNKKGKIRINLSCHFIWEYFYKNLFESLKIKYSIYKKKNSNTLLFRISNTKDIIELYNKIEILNIPLLKRKWNKIKNK